MSELLTAVRYDDENSVIHNNLGLAYFVREEFDRAERHIRRAIALSPAYTEARNNLGRVLIEQGLFQEAVQSLETALQDLTFPQPDKIRTNLGIAYFKMKAYSKAQNHLKKSLLLNKTGCRSHNYYGRTLFELKQFKNATIAFDQAISFCKAKKYDEPHFFSALSYLRMGQNEQASARFKELVELYPHGQYVEKARDLLRMIE